MRCAAQILAALAAIHSATATVSMVHLSLSGYTDEMAVDYVTDGNVSSVVAYGTSPSSLDHTATGGAAYDFYGVGYLHQVLMRNLTTNTQYYYKIQDGSSSSQTYSFINQPTARPPIYLIIADLGYANAQALPQITADAAAGVFDYVILAGDQAYDLIDEGGLIGNEYMATIEPVASQFPWMACPGNHEESENFTQFRNRFYGLEKYVGANSGTYTSLYYSWTQGIVHFLSISTEVYAYYPDPVEQANQIRFMEKDLAAANANRANVPWVVMYGHKGWYMDTTNWTDFGLVSSKYGVDVYFCGHVHNYERFVPYDAPSGQADFASVSADKGTYTNPKYMTTIVTGAPGNKETNVPCNASLATITAACTQNYGYGYFQVFNATHAHWNFKTAVPFAGQALRGSSVAADFSDDLWIIQNNHGMRE